MRIFQFSYGGVNVRKAIYLDVSNEDLGIDVYKKLFEHQKIENWQEPTFFYDENRGFELKDQMIARTSAIIVSEKTKKLLLEHDIGDCQFLPITIIGKNSQKTDRVYILNVCNVYNAYNYEKSKKSIINNFLGKEEFEVVEIEAFNENEIGTLDIFTFNHDKLFIEVYVSEKLRDSIKKANLTNVGFCEANIV